MLNVRFICWLKNLFAVATWFQHRFLGPDKHGVHFYVLEGILNFLTLPFSIRVPSIIFFRFLFLLKSVIGYSWNNSSRFLLVWRMFQFLRTTAVRFGKNRLYVNINGNRFGSCCSQSLFCSRSSLTSLSTFSSCSLLTRFWLKPCFKNLSFSSLEWWSKSFVVEEILFVRSVWLYGILFFNNFGCSELMLRKVWQSAFEQNEI